MNSDHIAKPCYVTVFQNDKNSRFSNYSVDHLTITFSYENEMAQSFEKNTLHRYVNNSNSTHYLDSNEAKVISSGHDFITYKLSQDLIQQIYDPSGRINMKVKINETMSGDETFIFDVIKQSERKHIIPQNGEYTLVADNIDEKYNNQTRLHDIQIFIDSDGYLMIHP